MGHIFISYSHKDNDYAHKLADMLQRGGFDVWIDARLDYGSQWPQEIQRQLDSCSAFIIIMSPRAFDSEWVQSELNRAKRKSKPIFPLLYEGDEPWLSVESTQFIDVRGGKLPDDEFYKDLWCVIQPANTGQTLKAPPPNLTSQNKAKKSTNSGLIVMLAVLVGFICISAAASLFYLKQNNWAFLPPSQTPLAVSSPTAFIPTETSHPKVNIPIPLTVVDVPTKFKVVRPVGGTTITPTVTKTFTPTPIKAWGSWDKPGGAFVGAPAAASISPNRLDVFVRGNNSHLMHRSWTGSAWSKWEDLGGELADSPACVSGDSRRMDCFVRGKNDSELWHITWNGAKWSAWEKVGGAFAGAPAASSKSVNRVDVFVRGTNSHLMHRYWKANAWSNWEDLGSELADSPACVSWDPKRIDCFIGNQKDSELWHISWNGIKWSAWDKVGGAFVGAATVASRTANQLDVFVRGTNTHLMHRSWNGKTWSRWEDLGGELADSPTCVSWASNRIDCFIRNKSDSELWHINWNGN
jgi:hypothetical protein